MRILFFFLFLFPPTLGKALNIVDADATHYEGGKVVLEGRVTLDHSHGKVSCSHAEVNLSKESAQLVGDVRFSLPEGGKIESAQALIEGREGIATFYTDVIYTTTEGLKISAREARIEWKPDKRDPRGLQKIAAKGDVRINQKDEWCIFAGFATLEPASQTLFLEGEEGRQLFFQNNSGKIFADRAEVYLNTKLCHLEGSVRMINRQGALSQIALADDVVISREEGELIFQAHPNKHALFYDSVNKLQVSAAQLKVKKDPVTGKETVRGIGDVRFHFSGQEFDRIKKQLAMEKDQ